MKKFFKKAAFWLGSVAVASGILSFSLSTSKVIAQVPEVVTVEAKTPIMDRIANCESGNGTAGSATQFKNGQVLISLNTNGTYDQGKFQINSIHNKEASTLGFNLATEEGNTAYAKYLYANKGTVDWSSSAHCWMK